MPDSLLNVRPLQLSGSLEVVDLGGLPRAFTKFAVFFKTGVNQLLDGYLLLLRSRSESILEQSLLERDEREVRVVLHREEVRVLGGGSFVARTIELPCAIHLLVESGISLAEQQSVRLSQGEGNNLP